MEAATFSTLKAAIKSVEPPVKLLDQDTGRLIYPKWVNDLIDNPENPAEAMKAVESIFDDLKIPPADEVYPDLFIGHGKGIHDTDMLRSKGINCILNVAEGHNFSEVMPVPEEKLKGINYHGMSLKDTVQAKDEGQTEKALRRAADKLEEIFRDPGARVVVNCKAGISRSSSVVITYLILKKNMTAGKAIATLRKKRDILPSDQFLVHIANISNKHHGLASVDPIDDLSVLQLDGMRKFLVAAEENAG